MLASELSRLHPPEIEPTIEDPTGSGGAEQEVAEAASPNAPEVVIHRLLEGTRGAPRTWAMPEEASQAKSSPRPPTSAQAADLLSLHRSLLKDHWGDAAQLANEEGQVIHTLGRGTRQASGPGWGCRCSKFDTRMWKHWNRHKIVGAKTVGSRISEIPKVIVDSRCRRPSSRDI